MKYQQLLKSVQSAAGLRLRIRLQPLYGPGEIVFPCTVAGGKYQISKRRILGYAESVPCVILDSVQSQANRMEAALLADIRDGKLKLPHLETDFAGIEGLVKEIGKITCFEAPHRIFDAILRDSIDEDGKHFPLTELGQKVINSNAKNATSIFQVSPASLLFGSWDSTGVSGGLGEKYTRCVVSEVVGINVEQTTRAGTRNDPLNIAKESFQLASKEIKDEVWDALAEKAAAKKKKLVKSSDINHGSVIWPGESIGDLLGGVTADYIQQSATVSFAALRQLHFPVAGKDKSPFAHAVLTAIALHAAALNTERGWHLRSRCDLIPDDGVSPEWEILDGSSTLKEALTADATRDVLNEAIAKAKEAGLLWNDEPIRLKPSPALQKLVVASQKAHRESASAE
ncbi:MAG: type I-U CRISPR-associated RAMP protein Csb1/Cas7u [Verrucomicrobia bacterium]|nr:type I-U CRISPR-associated RAMP protein Csb1/Cas7u [Verrucomicrobiota bacterium]